MSSSLFLSLPLSSWSRYLTSKSRSLLFRCLLSRHEIRHRNMFFLIEKSAFGDSFTTKIIPFLVVLGNLPFQITRSDILHYWWHANVKLSRKTWLKQNKESERDDGLSTIWLDSGQVLYRKQCSTNILSNWHLIGSAKLQFHSTSLVIGIVSVEIMGDQK